MNHLEKVQKLLRYRAAHDAWFAKMITEAQYGRPFHDKEPQIEDYLGDKPKPPEFEVWCTEIANAVGPSLRFASGQVRLDMNLTMLKLYAKYVDPTVSIEQEG